MCRAAQRGCVFQKKDGESFQNIIRIFGAEFMFDFFVLLLLFFFFSESEL